MNEEDQGPRADQINPENQTGTAGDDAHRHVAGQATPGLPPEGAAGGVGGWPPGPPGTGWPPADGTWPVRPQRRGFFREHPVLAIFLFLLLGLAFITIFWTYMAGRGNSGSAISKFSFGKKVGVVKIEGVIMEPGKVVKQIHRYRDDNGVSAVVIRVDSPGGTVGAAQEIYTEVKKLAKKKPVVVSMGTVAASGGYYVAAPAAVIFANPGTITGSIGVVMETTNFEGLLDWMRIKNRVIKSGKLKDVGSPYREMTEEEHEFLQKFVDSIHLQFEEVVAEGRGMSMEEVHKLADGRIYTGIQAKELGLVDELGNLWDAIDEAARRGGIKGTPKVIWPPRPRSNFFLDFMDTLMPGFSRTSAMIPSPVRVMYIMDIH